jgi:hypothetical protein
VALRSSISPAASHHICYQTDSGFTVVDVWADEQSFAAFGEIIGPATQKAGLDAKPVYAVQGSSPRTASAGSESLRGWARFHKGGPPRPAGRWHPASPLEATSSPSRRVTFSQL